MKTERGASPAVAPPDYTVDPNIRVATPASVNRLLTQHFCTNVRIDQLTASRRRTTMQANREEATARLTYTNGSGHKVLYATDYQLTDAGTLVLVDPEGRQHVFSSGADWHLTELPEPENYDQ